VKLDTKQTSHGVDWVLTDSVTRGREYRDHGLAVFVPEEMATLRRAGKMPEESARAMLLVKQVLGGRVIHAKRIGKSK